MKRIRNDILLIVAILLVALACFVVFLVNGKSENISVEIYVDSQLVYQEKLTDNLVQELEFNHVIICIKDKKVWVNSSDCPDKVCIHQGKISLAGQTITCLPQRVLVKLVGTEVDLVI